MRTWSDQQMWYFARASGLVAWSLLTISGLWGILLATRVLGERPHGRWLKEIHRYMAELTVGFVIIHLVTLVADDFVQFGFDDLFIPMRSQWQPGAVAWGIVAFYLLLAVELTSVVRGLQWRLWHRIHLLSYPMWLLASVHVLVAGTDTGRLLSTTAAVALGALVSCCAVVAFVRAVRSARLRGPGLRPQG